MSKLVLDGGWKFPFYELMWILIGGGLVAGGVVLGMNLRPAVTAPTATPPPAPVAELPKPMSNEELEAKVDSIIQAESSKEAVQIAAPAPEPSPKTGEVEKPFFSLQVGVYLNKSGAQAQVKSLQKKGLTAFTILRNINGRSLNYVYVGRFPVKQRALEYKAQLQSQAGLNSVIFQITK